MCDVGLCHHRSWEVSLFPIQCIGCRDLSRNLFQNHPLPSSLKHTDDSLVLDVVVVHLIEKMGDGFDDLVGILVVEIDIGRLGIRWTWSCFPVGLVVGSDSEPMRDCQVPSNICREFPQFVRPYIYVALLQSCVHLL
jgi:hypothetical protein